MSRGPVLVRDVVPEDLDALLELWAQTVRAASAGTPRPRADSERALARLAEDPDSRLLVGLHGDRVVAAIHLRRGPVSPIHLESVVQTSYMMVHPAFRKHGYGRALLESAASWAEECDIGYVAATSLSTSRDTHRFLTRLGLSTVATMRVSTTAGLRRKLTPERSGLPARRVLAQRRSMRRRAPGPVDRLPTGEATAD